MLMQPFPDVSTIFSLLLQQERQHSALYLGDTKELVNAMNTTGEGFNHDNRGRNFGRGGHGGKNKSSGKNSSKLCSHCGETGHLVDTCYFKHGFPPHMQRNKKPQSFGTASINNVNTTAEMNDEFNNTPSLSGQKEGGKSFDVLFSEEQKQSLIALLLKHEPSPSHSKSAAATVQAPSAGLPFLEDDWSC
ncbi:uncharacterized protein LOC107623956 isoform X2 [Arachis ipaensis]|uniref:uncharacterized protein n=1 Tax=Arachis hypogaea TaxID=3818 RepID=UPI0007AFA1BB|nr:uncharacterized protein LOC107623956 isoform X2 [Arachis ipaensis]XP_025631757.1 uncharacterized protein LOC112726549 [Arachis hypogaea]